MTKISAVLALLGILCATSANAQQGMNGCFLYEKDDFRGAEFRLGPNASMADFGTRRGWNDEISSAWNTPNCTLWLYEHSQFRGAGVFIQVKMYNLKRINGGFNDKTSSARCICT